MDGNVEKSYAVVGMSNGLDVLDVTDMTNPKDIAYFHGCENVWRDVKRYKETLYGISEYTATCACENYENGTQRACQEHISVLSPPYLEAWYPATEGRLSPPLSDIGDVQGSIWVVPEYNADGNTLTAPNNPQESLKNR